MISKPGKASSTKATTPAIFPIRPLYNRVMRYPEAGAQIKSKGGTISEINPIASKIRLSINFFDRLACSKFIVDFNQKAFQSYIMTVFH